MAAVALRRSLRLDATPDVVVLHVVVLRTCRHRIPPVSVLLDLLCQGFLGCDKECIVHVPACDCGGLQEVEAIAGCKSVAFLIGHLTLLVLVGLVAYQSNDELWIRILAGLMKPFPHVLEAVSPRDVVDQKRSSSPPVVASDDGAEAILAGRVPTLQLDLLPLHIDRSRAKLHPDGNLVCGAIPLVGELQQEAGLPHRLVTDNDELEELCIIAAGL
mmetsp:Transcript_33767/g.78428  ORF Transcript_33767/g.78428 Transcript_33767/m.78428 type:complete len:216 (+) Transcript_33767:146-793(+)